MEKFNLVIVSPEEKLYEGTADEVVVPGAEGTMSILARHAPLIASLGRGTIEIVSGAGEREFDIEGGFVEVSKKEAKESETVNKFVNIFVRQT